MRLLFVTIAIFCVAVSLGSNQDSWDDDTDVSTVPDQLGGSHKARTISKSGLRDKFLLKKLNEVRSKCSTPLPPITDFKVRLPSSTYVLTVVVRCCRSAR